ncbi:hypothetical protein CTEN210_12094 [Chaetoceros tenuissimus]|uniref:Uncharacterized protein n=1 Tax=Chaetoceros tenuissimus TaxID=426638 RepID=A0AAD3D0U5_9STRA|nr:hypothetical protein CTEN210_12094 [Chaetoceros tenuissimus]
MAAHYSPTWRMDLKHDAHANDDKHSSDHKKEHAKSGIHYSPTWRMNNSWEMQQESSFRPHSAGTASSHSSNHSSTHQQQHGYDVTTSRPAPFKVKSDEYYAPHVNALARWILDKDYLNAINLIKREPSRARTRITAHAFLGGHRDADVLPIHLLLSQADAPMDLITTLLRAYPESIHKVEKGYNRNCLHIALKSYVKDSVMSYLIQLNPNMCQQLDKLGRLPIHYAISNLHKDELIREMLHIYPESAKAFDKGGWTPLHVACQTYTSPELVEEILALNPEGILMRTNQGSTPLQVAQSSRKNRKEEILPFLQVAHDTYHNTPLIQNYRAAVAKHDYHSKHYVPRVTHKVV